MPKHLPVPLCVALVLAAACPSDDASTSSATVAETGGENDSGSTMMTSTMTTTSTTSPGTTPDPTTTSTSSTTSTSTTSDESSSGDGNCFVNEQCADDEVCTGDGSCIDAFSCDYEIRILALTGVSCRVDEIYWNMFRGEELVHRSEYAVCPLGWPGDFAPYVTTNQTASWRFLDANLLSDDLVFDFCFVEGCGPIPVNYLHDGGWTGTVDNDLYYMEIEILPTC